MYWQRVAARASAETPINKHGAREISEPTLNPCVTRAGFRHLRTRHRLTTQLRAVKSHLRFPAATEIPEVRYCAQGFNVGPRYFPGVVRVQRLRQSAFVLRLGYIDPAESFAFPLPACTSPTSKRAGYSFQPVSGFMLRNACNPPLATSGDQPGSVVVAPRRRFDVGPRLSGVSCHLSPSDLSRNRTAPLPTKPRQASRNRTGTFFVGGRR